MATRPDGDAPQDYQVGRNRPPKATQFQKGQSGNPEGRPRGPRSAPKSQIEKLIERGVMMTVDGVRKRVPITTFTAAMLMQQAKAGNVAAIRELNRMAEVERAAQRLQAGNDMPRQVNFTIHGLEAHLEEALCSLNLAKKSGGRLVLTPKSVARALEELGRPLTDRERRSVAQACPEYAAGFVAQTRERKAAG